MKADAATRRAGAEQLADFGAHAEINGSTGEWDSAGILAAGRHGLEYFRLFDPPHARLTGRRHDFRADFLRRYDSGADLVFGSLRADRDRFDSVAGGLSDNVVALRNAGAATFESWQGGAADRAKAHLDGLLARVATIRDRFTGLAATIGDAVDAVDRAVYDKAVATSRLYADRVDGRSAEDVRFLVDFLHRARKYDVDDDDLADAAALTGVTSGASGWRHRHARITAVASAVETWLHGVFAPAHEAKLAAFDEICATAREKLTAGWQALGAALEDGAAQDGAAQDGAAQNGVVPGSAAPQPVALSNAAPAAVAAAAQPVGTPMDGGERFAAGQVHGAAPMPGEEEPRRPVPAGTQSGSAGGTTGMGGGGMFGGAPMAGGHGNDDQQRRALGLPLMGLALIDDDPAPAGTIGDRLDPVTYNEAEEEAATIADDEVRRAEAETPTADEDPEDDLW